MALRKRSEVICSDCGNEIPINHRSTRRHFCKECEIKRNKDSFKRFYKNKKEKENGGNKMKKEKWICVYHDDLDGICSAAIVRKAHPDCEFKAINYGDSIDFNEFVGRHLILVDFSFPTKMMNKIFEATNNKQIKTFTWIDHHKTAKEKNLEMWRSDYIPGIRSTEKAACELTWIYFFFPDITIPKCVKLIAARDMWKDLRDAEEFCEYANIMLTYPTNVLFPMFFENSPISKQFIKNYVEKGNILLLGKRHRIEESFNEGYDATFEGHKCRVVNTNHDISELGEYIYKDKVYPVAFIWSERKGKIIVNLRSKTVDVSKLAKKHGGGGHPSASGFELNYFDELFETDSSEKRGIFNWYNLGEDKNGKRFTKDL